MNNELTRAIKDELAGQPVNYAFGMGGKHPYVRISRGESSRRVVFSGSPSDIFCVKNVRGDVRRALKELGVERLGTLGKKIVEATEARKPMTQNPQLAQPRVLPDLSKKPNGNAGIHTTKAEPKAEKEKPKKSAMSHDEVIAVTRLLLTKADIDEVNEVVKYHDGWSDERIFEILKAAPDRENLRIDTITDMRKEKFGSTPEEIAALRAIRVASAAKASASKVGKSFKGDLDLLRSENQELRARIEILEGAILGPKARL